MINGDLDIMIWKIWKGHGDDGRRISIDFDLIEFK